MNKKLRLLIIPVLFWTACNSNSGGNATVDTDTSSVAQQTPESQEKWFVVAYDDVRMRETPGMDGKVVVTLKSGTKLKDTGERSSEETTVNLRGKDVTSTWYKMETETGKVAWIFGGTVEASTAPAPKSANQVLESQLNAIDKKDCSSIMKGINTFKKTAAGKTPNEADMMAPVLEAFLYDCVMASQQELDKVPNQDDLFLLAYNPEKKKIPQNIIDKHKKWEGCGLEIIFPEGIPSMMLTPGLISDHLGSLFSPGVKQYFAQLKVEEKEGFGEDAGLVVSIQKVAERSIFWEKWLAEFPDNLYEEDGQMKLDNYIAVLVAGMDNTPSFDHDGKNALLNSDFKKTYEWLMKTHPDTRTGKTVAEFYNILKANNFYKSAKAEEFIENIWN